MDIGPGLHQFTFDRVFDLKSNQEEVYNFAAKPVVESNIFSITSIGIFVLYFFFVRIFQIDLRQIFS